MADSVIRFDDGAAYERMMGTWSRLAGEVFVDWVKPKPHQHWLDVGCGNGAFTELLIDRCAASKVHGIDPSVAQIDFARLRRQSHAVTFQCADAESLTFPDDSFDAAVMALVIFFLPSPAKGVQEMVRVVRSGGLVAAYAWDAVGLGMTCANRQGTLGNGISARTTPQCECFSIGCAAPALGRCRASSDRNQIY